MSLSRPLPSWAVLFCWSLMLASETVSLAAESATTPPRAAAASEKGAAVQAPAEAPSLLGTIGARLQEANPPKAPRPAAKAPSLLGTIGARLQEANPPKDPRPADVAADNDPNVRNMEANFRPQIQQALYAELAFLRRVCKTDAPQFADVVRTSQGQLRGIVREYAIAVCKPMRVGNAVASASSDPRLLIQRRLATIADAKLGPEQAAQYRDECEKRNASRRRAVVLNLVAALDERVVLTAEQRAKLVESLSSKYQDAWDQWFQMLPHNTEALPPISDDLIVPLLMNKQILVWRHNSQQNMGIFWGVGFAQGGMDVTEIQEIARIAREVSDE